MSLLNKFREAAEPVEPVVNNDKIENDETTNDTFENGGTDGAEKMEGVGELIKVRDELEVVNDDAITESTESIALLALEAIKTKFGIEVKRVEGNTLLQDINATITAYKK